MKLNTESSFRRVKWLFFGVSMLSLISGSSHVLSSDGGEKRAQISPTLVNSDIASILETEDDVVLFLTALKESDIWHSVLAASDATLFVPTDIALQHEGSAFLLEIVLLKSENAERLNNLLAQHYISDRAINIKELSSTAKFPDNDGGCLSLSPQHLAVKVGPEAYITHAIEANNGFIYFIDRLLWTPYNSTSNCS